MILPADGVIVRRVFGTIPVYRKLITKKGRQFQVMQYPLWNPKKKESSTLAGDNPGLHGISAMPPPQVQGDICPLTCCGLF